MYQSNYSYQQNYYSASEVQQSLARYQDLRREEKRLQFRVAFLEKKAASYGPLRVEVDIAELLHDEKIARDQARREIEALEAELERLELKLEKPAAGVAENRLARLLRDIQSLRGLWEIYQLNINQLEERQAVLGLEATLDLENELMLTRAQLATLRHELAQLEADLITNWKVDQATLGKIAGMSEAEIQALAAKLASKRAYPSPSGYSRVRPNFYEDEPESGIFNPATLIVVVGAGVFILLLLKTIGVL